ncbi:response regulator [Clostridium sp. ZS2-4]|uniref:response regulator n=1 Tax=Clostridium sp. ZS2-4 TaxID=2987703 RepID=UPI00227A1188|nr:response regulator [Clostridium sp. ZS2-4]MCY6355441.1 response regulator [Clostridium sp. ZS2-4]
MKKVLLINDCKFEKMIIKDLLIRLGYSVQLGDEYEALSKTKEFSPDIIIVNLIMKETTGDRLIKKLKDINSSSICVLSSSNSLDIDDYKENGVDRVIQTPVNEEKLKMALAKKENHEIKLRFCPYCGNKLDEMFKKIIFCPFCGEHL